MKQSIPLEVICKKRVQFLKKSKKEQNERYKPSTSPSLGSISGGGGESGLVLISSRFLPLVVPWLASSSSSSSSSDSKEVSDEAEV